MAGVGAIPVQDLKSRGAQFAGQGDILHEVAGYRGMAADFFVSLPPEKEELSIGGTQGG